MSGLDPLPEHVSIEIRRGVGRLLRGASELAVIALVSPVFLLGVFLAVEGASAARHVARDRVQRELDVFLFAGYGAALVALAVRARLGASAARRILPDALSPDPGVRAGARARMQALAGTGPVRRGADWAAAHGCLLSLGLAAVAAAGWLFLRTPDPVWLVVFVGTAAAMDVRWRALVSDVVDQMPR